MLRLLPPRSSALIAAAATLLTIAGCSSDDSASPDTTIAAASDTTAADTCPQTTADPSQTATFTFLHTAAEQGVDNTTEGSFLNVQGVTVSAAAVNDGPTTVTITDAGGATIATISNIEAGESCGIDHDFAPGDYFIADDRGNGTQFSSFADQSTETSAGADASIPSEPIAGATATLIVGGTPYQFASGACSPTLDPDLFLFRDPAEPGFDATYFALTVTDLEGSATIGGTHEGAVTYQVDNVAVASASDLTIEIARDLSNGRFSGTDFLTGVPITGSYTC